MKNFCLAINSEDDGASMRLYRKQKLKVNFVFFEFYDGYDCGGYKIHVTLLQGDNYVKLTKGSVDLGEKILWMDKNQADDIKDKDFINLNCPSK